MLNAVYILFSVLVLFGVVILMFELCITYKLMEYKLPNVSDIGQLLDQPHTNLCACYFVKCVCWVDKPDSYVLCKNSLKIYSVSAADERDHTLRIFTKINQNQNYIQTGIADHGVRIFYIGESPHITAAQISNFTYDYY